MLHNRLTRIQKVIDNRQPDITVVLENVFDRHNISAVLRTCDSVGIGEIFTIYTEAPPHHQWGFRSSAGAWKWVQVHTYTNLENALKDIREKYKRVMVAAITEEAKSIYESDFTEPVALVFGNEQKGCSASMIAACDGQIFIPQAGMAVSLNISVACAVTLFEAFRQKMAAGHYKSSRMPPAEKAALYQAWTDYKEIRAKKDKKP